MSSSPSRSDETARSGSWFGKLRSDALAGLINAVVSVPSGMATAALAGIPRERILNYRPVRFVRAWAVGEA
jgi:MFS superfamily sulfate permease-like transporter